MKGLSASAAKDPRLFQIVTLALLLFYGIFWLDFEITVIRAAIILVSALGTQALWDRLGPAHRGASTNIRSALISGLSLCLLLRTDRPALAALAAIVAISSKFLIRFRGKHIFNPTNGGLVAMVLLTGQVWVSPGQWGSAALFALLMACLGVIVVNRAARSDVTFAFIGAYCALLFGWSFYLGEPARIPFHRLESGALLLFTFFMISDPKTTPDSRAGRVLFATLVAVGAWYVQFRLFRTNGLLWSLAACSMGVPLIDLLLPGTRYAWNAAREGSCAGLTYKERVMKRLVFERVAVGLVVASVVVWSTTVVHGFCGFYVGKADTKLFNKASQVVLVRDGDRTVLTMANDFQGAVKEFAIVIPVPTMLTREQIHVGDKALVDHLDAYSAPRLVEYFDEDPCRIMRLQERMAAPMSAAAHGAMDSAAKSLGVTIEARYTVGEYDILILSAQQSTGLETWLRENGYKIPPGASAVLGTYLKQNMRFFVAKVNLAEQAKLGFSYLRPLQVAYESPKFMLPIRLGMVNASGSQDLYVYALTRKGRVESTNYRTVKVPSDVDLPVYLKDQGEFPKFYKAMFARQVDREDGRSLFTEYAWDMRWCDPCAADPLSNDELRRLGVFWVGGDGVTQARGAIPQPRPQTGATEVFLTRLHVRYDASHFPEDLVFQETSDRTNFQGRYVLRHAWTGTQTCSAVDTYRSGLRTRHEQEAERLASLTGWDISDIRTKMSTGDPSDPQPVAGKWWDRLWR